MKHQINTSLRILIIYLLVVLALCLAASCNPVKKVLKDTAKMQEVFNEGVKKGWCANDTITVSKSDTIISLDTLHVIETKNDTLRIGDTVYIDRVEYRTIEKTVQIRDTVNNTVLDTKLIDLLKDELSEKQGQLKAKENELEQSKAETKEARKQRNDWRLRTWILGIAFIVWLLRIPIMKLIKPI